MDSKIGQKKPKRRGKEVGRGFEEEDETIPKKRPQPYRPPVVSQTLPNISSKKLMEKLSPRDSVVKREEAEMKKEKQGKISHPTGKSLVRMDTTIMAARWKIRARGKRRRGRRPRRRMAGFIQTEADLEEEDEDGDFIQVHTYLFFFCIDRSHLFSFKLQIINDTNIISYPQKGFTLKRSFVL